LFLGPYVLVALFFGSILGTVAGLVAARGRKMPGTRIPFGPWLAAGAALAAVIGPAAWAWYLSLVGLG
jgi:leader peptidase (prepilin peptidase)/N-methyltransferase